MKKNYHFVNKNTSEVVAQDLSNIAMPAGKQLTFLVSFLVLLLMAFQLNGQSLTLLSPNGGETWMTGTTQTISWEWDGDGTEVYIFYSPNEGSEWFFIGNADENTTSLEITADLSAGDFSKMRVSSAIDEMLSDDSDDYFTVVYNPVYFSTPQAGEQYYTGEIVSLFWDSFMFYDYDLSFSADGGENWTLLIENSPLNFYDWTVPELNSTQCMFKVSDPNDPDQFGLSPNFSVTDAPTVSFTSPVEGDVWTYGEDVVMSWTGSNLPFVVYFDYSLDGGQTWKYFGNAYSEPTSGSADVNIPKVSSGNAKIRMLTSDYNLVIGESDIFTIYTPPVIVFSPYEGQEFYIGSIATLYWLANGVDLVNVEFSQDGGVNWQLVEENLDADGYSFNWTISGTPSENCLVKVSDAGDTTKYDISGKFSTLEAPVITLTNPTGNELLKTESIYTITWSYEPPEFYYLVAEYSVDSGATWTNIASGMPALASVDWKTPAVESEQCLVRIYDANLPFVSDTSEVFALRDYPDTPICIVSVDSATNQNVIIWEKPATDQIRNYIVYKETNQVDQFEPIGTVPYDSLPFFRDVNSNPAVKSYRYKLGFDDSEGYVYPMGDLHQTIHLTISKGVGNSWNLSWGKYLGFDVDSYNIYRSANGMNYQLIETISSSFFSFTDINAPEGNVYYFIEVIHENGCTLNTRDVVVNSAISNIVTNNFLSISTPEESLISNIYPNPANQNINLITGLEGGSLFVQMCDITGKVIREQDFNQVSANDKVRMSTSDIPDGAYFLKIRYNDKVLTKKVIVRH